MKYSCIICSYNEGAKLARTVASIRRAVELRKRNDVEIIIIDDASTDDSNPIDLQSDAVTVLVNPANQGISYSRNKGIQNASGDYVVFFDAHILFHDNVDFFGELDSVLELENIAGVSGVYETKDRNKDKNRIRDIVRELYRKKSEAAFLISAENFTTVSSCVFCIRKDIIGKYMFNDEFKGVAAEDTMLQLQFLKDGIRIMHNPKVRVIHDADLSYLGLLSKIIYQANGTHRLLAKASKGRFYIPYSTFYLDFPIWTFLSFWGGGIAFLLGGISFSFYLAFLAGSLVLDFFPLLKILRHKSNPKEKLQVAFYILLNEGIKIFAWPVSIAKDKYTMSDLIYILKNYVCFYVEKLKKNMLLKFTQRNAPKREGSQDGQHVSAGL